MIELLKTCFFLILGIAALFFLVFSIVYPCCQIWAYKQYKEFALNRTYQVMNYKTFVSTYSLFPERYKYYRDEGDLYWLTYKIIAPGSHMYFPETSEYYILFSLTDWFRVDNYLARVEVERERRNISERETNAVLEDLQRLCRQEIEKADKEVSAALEEMRQAVNSKMTI